MTTRNKKDEENILPEVSVKGKSGLKPMGLADESPDLRGSIEGLKADPETDMTRRSDSTLPNVTIKGKSGLRSVGLGDETPDLRGSIEGLKAEPEFPKRDIANLEGQGIGVGDGLEPFEGRLTGDASPATIDKRDIANLEGQGIGVGDGLEPFEGRLKGEASPATIDKLNIPNLEGQGVGLPKTEDDIYGEFVIEGNDPSKANDADNVKTDEKPKVFGEREPQMSDYDYYTKMAEKFAAPEISEEEKQRRLRSASQIKILEMLAKGIEAFNNLGAVKKGAKSRVFEDKDDQTIANWIAKQDAEKKSAKQQKMAAMAKDYETYKEAYKSWLARREAQKKLDYDMEKYKMGLEAKRFEAQKKTADAIDLQSRKDKASAEREDKKFERAKELEDIKYEHAKDLKRVQGEEARRTKGTASASSGGRGGKDYEQTVTKTDSRGKTTTTNTSRHYGPQGGAAESKSKSGGYSKEDKTQIKGKGKAKFF